MPRRTAITSAIPAAQQLVPLSDGDSDNHTDDQADQDQPGPAILISPVKARAAKWGIVNKGNTEVWNLSDSVIIGEQSNFRKKLKLMLEFRGINIYLALNCI